jgi:hypothetical protein
MGRITRCNFKEGKSNRKQNSEMERVTGYINPEQSEVHDKTLGWRMLQHTKLQDGKRLMIYYMTSG